MQHRSSNYNLQRSEINQEGTDITIYNAQFNFKDLINICRLPVSVDLNIFNKPEVLDSNMNQLITGNILPISVIVFPIQLLIEVTQLMDTYLTQHPDDSILLWFPKTKISINKTLRQDTLKKKIIFTPSDCVDSLKRIFQQKQQSIDNQLYNTLSDLILQKEVNEQQSKEISNIFEYCGSVQIMSNLIKQKRMTIKGYIPKRVIYICPRLLFNTCLYGYLYNTIQVEAGTGILRQNTHIQQQVAIDCLKNQQMLSYDSYNIKVTKLTSTVQQQQSKQFFIIVIQKLPTQRLIEFLKKQNAIFCPLDQLHDLLQKESDRHQILLYNMQLSRNPENQSIFTRRLLPDRTKECLNSECPICYQQFYLNVDESNFIPVFQRCCQKTICYKCIMNYVRTPQQTISCPMCRTDMEVDITKKQLIIPISDSVPQSIKDMIGSYQPVPRLTQSILIAINTLLQHNPDLKRIAFLPDGPATKEEIEHVMEFILSIQHMQDIGDIKVTLENGFGLNLPDLREFHAFNDYILISKSIKYIYIADQRGVDYLDISHLEAFVVFSKREMQRIVELSSNRFFNKTKDINNRIVFIEVIEQYSKCYEVESG